MWRCVASGASGADVISSLWWLMMLMLLLVVPMVVGVVTWKKSVNRRRHVHAAPDEAQPEERSLPYMTNNN